MKLKDWQVVSFLAMKLNSKTREKEVKVLQNVEKELVLLIMYWYSGTNPNYACWDANWSKQIVF